MKFLSLLFSVLIITYILSGCNSKSGSQGGLSGDTLKAGEKAIYSKNGKLQYIIETRDGKANGRVREYHPEGYLYMDAIFKDDHRNGKCTHYFKNGIPFSVSYFKNGAKDSIETKYNDKGHVIALVPYKNDKVQPGLKEFKNDGTELIDNASLVIKAVNNLARGGKYYLSVSLTEPRKNVKFYAAPQSDPDSRELLEMSGEQAKLIVPVSASGFVIKDIYIDAEYRTRMGNTRRLQKLYKFSSGK
jgi:major membrane immunogen (membrane-anchored lipoprotein)